ncbi:MAG: hypothetical protein ACM3OC_09400 [Deltaproteobacteria bacterium]
MNRLRKYIIPVLFAVAVASYGAYLIAGHVRAQKLLPVASRFADFFYASFNTGDYNRLYESAAFEGCSKCTIRLDKFKGIMQFVMERLGPVRTWTRTGYSVSEEGASTRITMRFRVEHERGKSDERLVIVKKGDEWLLSDYNIASEALKKR